MRKVTRETVSLGDLSPRRNLIGEREISVFENMEEFITVSVEAAKKSPHNCIVVYAWLREPFGEEVNWIPRFIVRNDGSVSDAPMGYPWV